MNISKLWDGINDFVNNIKDIMTDFYNILISLINFFPSPFKEIMLSFIGIILIVIVYRTIKK